MTKPGISRHAMYRAFVRNARNVGNVCGKRRSKSRFVLVCGKSFVKDPRDLDPQRRGRFFFLQQLDLLESCHGDFKVRILNGSEFP